MRRRAGARPLPPPFIFAPDTPSTPVSTPACALRSLYLSVRCAVRHGSRPPLCAAARVALCVACDLCSGGACAQLPVSRFQRDLTDSTVLRNAGMVRHPLRPSPSWAHSQSGPVPLNAAQTPAPRARCCRNIQRATDGTVPSPLLGRRTTVPRPSVGMLLRRMLRRATTAFHATSYPALHGVRCEVACGYSEYS